MGVNEKEKKEEEEEEEEEEGTRWQRRQIKQRKRKKKTRLVCLRGSFEPCFFDNAKENERIQSIYQANQPTNSSSLSHQHRLHILVVTVIHGCPFFI